MPYDWARMVAQKAKERGMDPDEIEWLGGIRSHICNVWKVGSGG